MFGSKLKQYENIGNIDVFITIFTFEVKIDLKEK